MKHIVVAFLSLLCLVSAANSQTAAVTPAASQQTGNAFAEAVTVQSPKGGTYVVSYDNWINNAGTVRMDYTNYHLPINEWIYNGQWVYTGSLLPNGNLDGTLKGKWSITGLDLGYGSSGIVYDMSAVFSGGFATLTISFVYNGQTITLQPYRFTQSAFLTYLF